MDPVRRENGFPIGCMSADVGGAGVEVIGEARVDGGFRPISVAEPHHSMEGGEAAVLAQPHVPRGARLHTLLDHMANPTKVNECMEALHVRKSMARAPSHRQVSTVPAWRQFPAGATGP